MKLCDGAIAHVSTITGGYGAGGGGEKAGADPALDSGSGGGETTYIVVAGEDGAVRFYDLKFRVEVNREMKRVRVL